MGLLRRVHGDVDDAYQRTAAPIHRRCEFVVVDLPFPFAVVTCAVRTGIGREQPVKAGWALGPGADGYPQKRVIGGQRGGARPSAVDGMRPVTRTRAMTLSGETWSAIQYHRSTGLSSRRTSLCVTASTSGRTASDESCDGSVLSLRRTASRGFVPRT